MYFRGSRNWNRTHASLDPTTNEQSCNKSSGPAFSVHRLTVDNLLVFGNRNRKKDYLFQSEWEDYSRSHSLSLLLAFSRDGRADERKTYVQDVIYRDGRAAVYDTLVRRCGMVFISGSSGKMPQGVKDAVIEIIKEEEGISREEAGRKLVVIEKEGRWKQETW